MSDREKDLRIPALRRFAVAITLLNTVGQSFLGFEQAWAHLVISVLTAYTTELLIETIDAWATRRAPRYSGGAMKFFDFLLSPHITGCAVAMLLYANGRFLPIAFASATAIASKAIFRLRASALASPRHFLNPSNFGITATLLLFPWVSIAPPYQFTENLWGIADWILPAIIVVTGSLLNGKFTGKLPLIAGWLGMFALQAVMRTMLGGGSTLSALLPMTGTAFILFTFYMVTDPATTPHTLRRQVAFGAAVALVYGALVSAHVVFDLFFALTIVSAGRGALMAAAALRAQWAVPQAAVTRAPLSVAGSET
jgi:enediyne biosynthesis protein E5